MSKRIVGIDKETGEEIPVGDARVLLSSAGDAIADGRIILEHLQFDTVDKPEMIVPDPHLALVLGEPLCHFHQNGRWHTHKYRYGQVCIRQSGESEAIQSADSGEAVLVSINAQLMNQIAAQMDLPPHIQVMDNRAADSDLLHALVLGLRDEVASDFPGGRLLYESMQTTLCSYLLTHHSGRIATDPSHHFRRGGLSPQTLKRIEDYVAERYRSDISLTELAQLAFMSTYHFSRMFKMTTGFSPYNYLSHLRVKKAETLIRGGSSDIGHIALAVGFRDNRALYRQFKRILGETPASYIRRFQ